jgi:hypothetical protein
MLNSRENKMLSVVDGSATEPGRYRSSVLKVSDVFPIPPNCISPLLKLSHPALSKPLKRLRN